MRGLRIAGDVALDGSARAIPLSSLAIGVSARIVAPPAGHSISRRLADLGFVPGTELRIVRRAPFGDPVELEIRGYRLCLRAEQIAHLEVIPGADPAP